MKSGRQSLTHSTKPIVVRRVFKMPTMDVNCGWSSLILLDCPVLPLCSSADSHAVVDMVGEVRLLLIDHHAYPQYNWSGAPQNFVQKCKRWKLAMGIGCMDREILLRWVLTSSRKHHCASLCLYQGFFFGDLSLKSNTNFFSNNKVTLFQRTKSLNS